MNSVTICKFLLLFFFINIVGLLWESYRWKSLTRYKVRCHYGETNNPLRVLSCSFQTPYIIPVVIVFIVIHFIPNFNNLNFIFKILFYGIFLGFLELLAGILIEKIQKKKNLDYSENFANIGGYADLYHSIIWGIGAFILIDLIIPFLDKTIASKICKYKPVLLILIIIFVLTLAVYIHGEKTHSV
jgi:uncharacterized membrane protein